MGEKDAIEEESGIIIEVDEHGEPIAGPVTTPDRDEAVEGVTAEPGVTSDARTENIIAGDLSADEAGAKDSPSPHEGAATDDPETEALVSDSVRSDLAGGDHLTGDDPSDVLPPEYPDATETRVADGTASESDGAGDPVTIDESSESVLAQDLATGEVTAEPIADDVIVNVVDDPASDASAVDGGIETVVRDDAVTTEDVTRESGVEYAGLTVMGGVAHASADGDAGDADGIPADNFEPPARASAELKAILEALIFASPEPLSLKALTKLLDSEPKEDVAIALVGLKEDYERPGGLQLVEVAGGYQIVTRHDLHEWVRRLFHERSTQKLSAQALETLAVVAYRQPITAVEITEIRGVNTSGVLNTLLERHLIKIVGRKAVVGRPFMYSTTKEFLIRFGLNDLTDLPRVEDMVDALGLEAPLLVEQAPLEDQLPLEEPDTESDDTEGESDDPEQSEVLARDESDEPEGGGGPPGSVH